MSDDDEPTETELRYNALALARNPDDSPDEVVKRAETYLKFLQKQGMNHA